MTTKIVGISDTHSYHHKIDIPDADVLIHSGDITGKGEISTIESFAKWLQHLPHARKIVIAGNHDFCYERHHNNHDIAIKLLEDAGAIYLQDSGIEIDGLYYWGSSWNPVFFNWAFNLPRGKPLADKWAFIPDRTNILITHTPPYGILDHAPRPPWGFENVGCQDLLNRINQLPNLKAHIFGHIHFDGGKVEEVNGVKFVNAAICTEQYKPTNPPVVFEV